MKEFESFEGNDYITCGDCAYGLELVSCECCKKERQYYEFPLTATCFKCKVEAEEKKEEPEIKVKEE
jgi:hypothetical protein